MFYGQPVTDAARLGTLTSPVLGIFGGADQSIPLEDVRAFEAGLKTAGVESTVTVYPDQPHAFVKNAEGIATDPVQQAAWDQMVAFFSGTLRGTVDASTAPASLAPVTDFYGWAPIMRLGLGHLGHPSPWQSTDAAAHH